MRNKKLLIIMSVLLLFVCAIGFAACSNKSKPNETPVTNEGGTDVNSQDGDSGDNDTKEPQDVNGGDNAGNNETDAGNSNGDDAKNEGGQDIAPAGEKDDQNDFPVLQLEYTVGDTVACVNAIKGGFTWEVKDENGEAQVITTDTAHPLDMDYTDCTITDVKQIDELRFLFSEKPTSYRILRWSEDYMGNAVEHDTDYEVLIPESDKLILTSDNCGYVYQVIGEWERGEVAYSFYIPKK